MPRATNQPKESIEHLDTGESVEHNLPPFPEKSPESEFESIFQAVRFNIQERYSSFDSTRQKR